MTTNEPSVSPKVIAMFLDGDLRRLAALRQKKAALLAAFEREFNDVVHRMAAAREEIGLIEQEEAEVYASVANEAKVLHAMNGSTQPHPNVAIKIVKGVAYQESDAFLWAKEHHMCLKLDARAFEKIAKAAPGDMPFVTQTAEPKAYVDSDLSGLLAEET